jgi:hypothetical protein
MPSHCAQHGRYRLIHALSGVTRFADNPERLIAALF